MRLLLFRINFNFSNVEKVVRYFISGVISFLASIQSFEFLANIQQQLKEICTHPWSTLLELIFLLKTFRSPFLYVLCIGSDFWCILPVDKVEHHVAKASVNFFKDIWIKDSDDGVLM